MSLNKCANTLPIPKWLWNRLRVWQRRCHLDGYSLNVEFAAKGKAWTVRIVPGYKEAYLFIPKPDYDALSPAECDRRICHEFFHVFNAPVSDLLGKLIGFGSYVYKECHDAEERRAEDFADIMTRAYARRPA
jgi:hypothetical protein